VGYEHDEAKRDTAPIERDWLSDDRV